MERSAVGPEEFRAIGHRVIDWIADYRRNVAEQPVMARTAPGEVKRALPAEPPLLSDPLALPPPGPLALPDPRPLDPPPLEPELEDGAGLLCVLVAPVVVVPFGVVT